MQWQILLILILSATLTSAKKKKNTKLKIPNKPVQKLDDSDNVRTPCEMLREEWTWNSFRGEPHEEQSLRIVILWDDEPGYAAAALLRATLVAAGHYATCIELRNRGFTDPSSLDSNILTVEAKSAHLQVRLTSTAAQSSICTNASIWSFYQDENTLMECGFMMSGTKRLADGIIYLVNAWDETCADEFIFNTASSTRLELQELERLVLQDYIQNSKNSFLFLDNYQWTDSTNVWLMKLPEEYVDNCALNFPKNYSVSLKFGDGLPVPESFLRFSPTSENLKSLLEEYRTKNQSNIKEIACGWALREKNTFENWQIIAHPSTVVVIVCNIEMQDYIKELLMTGMLEGYTNTYASTLINSSKILIQLFNADCTNANWLHNKFMYWLKNKFISDIEGVILPNILVAAAAPFASDDMIPLLTYDLDRKKSTQPQSMVRSCTGHLENLVIAIRRLLANCGWQRIAIISDPTQLATVLSTALNSSNTLLTIREINVKSLLVIPQALQELLNANARVFIVNTEAATAAKVLAAAHELNMTRDKGYTWIVREYDKADNATSVMKPYSVSFWWRGERNNKANSDKSSTKNGDRMTLRTKLDELNYKRAWPIHAAPILDALLTVREGVRREGNNYTWTGVRRNRSFWNSTTGEQIQGINQNLSFDEQGVTAPLVFVQQWDFEPRPHVLATWRSGEWRDSTEKCSVADNPPNDGSIFCISYTGDDFKPTCRDSLWILCIVIAASVVIGIVIAAIRWSRKAILAHDLRIKEECTKRMLSRRERVFEALAEHVVERSSLELIQELGTGRFGRVYHGFIRESDRRHQHLVIAAKTLREEASSAEESEFLREASTLATLNHDHIIRFVGVCVMDGPPLLLMEFAFFGDLLQYLQARLYLVGGTASAEGVLNVFENDEKVHVSARALTKLAKEAAMALAYLAQLGIVHRDVRASNCLIDDRRCLKLADFGLARATGTVDGEYSCRRGLFPVLWMAPESLAKGMSSAASDVWSFGVVVFEMVTLGRRPYGTQSPPTVLQHVLAGGRPRLPWDASVETRALVRACWRREPEDRPTAARLVEWLSTRWRALRPALVDEFVDIESHVYGDSVCRDLDLHCPNNLWSQTVKKEKSN